MPPKREQIEAGSLRHYVTIEHKVEVAKGQRGDPKGIWTALYEDVPALIEALTGKQLEITRQLVPTATHRVTLRYHAGVTAQMRVAYRGKYLNVEYVAEGDYRLRYQELTCTEQRGGAT